jgi:tRNA-dihydrouridine synthase 1
VRVLTLPPRPSLPSGRRSEPYTPAHGIPLLREYLHLVLQYPTPMRMVRGHVHKLIGGWLAEFHDLRDLTNTGELDIQVGRFLL